MIEQFLLGKITSHLPYTPNDEQRAALMALAGFLTSHETDRLLVINGYAGTGKSSLLGATVKALTHLQQKTVLMAPTGRAAKVFAAYAGQKACTIHKKIYRQKAFSNEFTGFSLADNLHEETVFIVDEASMISNSPTGNHLFGSGCLLDDLVRYVYSGKRCRLILMGDAAQLPPVMLTESPALNVGFLQGYHLDIQEIHLTGVVRQNESSGILQNATLIREKLRMHDTARLPRLLLDRFEDISRIGGDELTEVISSAYDRHGVDGTIVICRSNKRAAAYNNGIRNHILWHEEEISSGDRLMVVRNSYFWTHGQDDPNDFIANGETMQVMRVRRTYEFYGFRFYDLLVRFQDDESEVEIRVLADTLRTDTPALPKEMNDRLFFGVYNDGDEQASKAERLKRVKQDPFYNAVQIKYAYAITCHKAQGGQWHTVFIDIGYLADGAANDDFYRWLYTAITRATDRIYFVNLPDAFVNSP